MRWCFSEFWYHSWHRFRSFMAKKTELSVKIVCLGRFSSLLHPASKGIRITPETWCHMTFNPSPGYISLLIWATLITTFDINISICNSPTVQWRIYGGIEPYLFWQKKSVLAIGKNRRTWFAPFVLALMTRENFPHLCEILNTPLQPTNFPLKNVFVQQTIFYLF